MELRRFEFQLAGALKMQLKRCEARSCCQAERVFLLGVEMPRDDLVDGLISRLSRYDIEILLEAEVLRDDSRKVFEQALLHCPGDMGSVKHRSERFVVSPTQAPYHGLAAALLIFAGLWAGDRLIAMVGALFAFSFLFHTLTLAGLVLVTSREKAVFQAGATVLWLLLLGHFLGFDLHKVSPELLENTPDRMIGFFVLTFFAYKLGALLNTNLPFRGFLLVATFLAGLSLDESQKEVAASWYFIAAIWGCFCMWLGFLRRKKPSI